MILLGIIFLITTATFRGFFNFEICCDDTLAAYNALNSGISLKQLFSPYGGQVIGMGLMYKLFGFHSPSYILTLLSLRFLAATSIYILGLQLTKKKSIAFFSSLLFAIGYAGINTAEYAHLNNIYLGIFFLCIGLSSLFRYYKKYSRKINILSIILFSITSSMFTMAIIIATVRVSSVIIYWGLVEILLLLLKKNTTKAFLVRLVILGLFILLLKQLGSFGGDSTYHIEMIKFGFSQSFSNISNALKSFYYLASIYFDILSPPFLDKIILQSLHSIGFIEIIKSKLFILLFSIVGVFTQMFIFKNKRQIRFMLVSVALWATYLTGFYLVFNDVYQNLSTLAQPLGNTNYEFSAMNAIFGGYFIFIVLSILYYLLIHKFINIAFKVTLLLIWPITFIAITFFFSPRTFAFETFLSYAIEAQESYVHYYLVPAIGIYLLVTYIALVVIPKVTPKINFRFWVKIFIVILVIGNVLGIQQYINSRFTYRNRQLLENISQNINKEITGSFKRDKRPIVYFSKNLDDANIYPYAVSEWGFAPNRYSLLNNRLDIIPYFTDTDFVTFSQELSRIDNLSIEDVYSFEVTNYGVISKTGDVRKKLNKLDFFTGH